jgi:hypothetical protein
MKYKLTDKCPKQVIMQSLRSGDYDYSEFDSLKAAWEAERLHPWVKESKSKEKSKQEFLSTLEVYSQEETLEAAEAGYDWPVKFGYVKLEE